MNISQSLWRASCGLLIMSAITQAELNWYGYMSLYYENVGELPDGSNDPGEFDYANLNLMMQGNVSDEVKVYVNLKGTSDITVQNYWGEYMFNDMAKVRIGKIYRPFGQYNELLDAIPSYLGMEPPELFDKDHLMLPRTGKIMLHGNIGVGSDNLRYAYMLDSDEKMKSGNGDEISLSHSLDLNYTLMDMMTIGTSAFFANEVNGSNTAVGDGSPRTGVLPWMSEDKYGVFGGYMKLKWQGLTVKAAYWQAKHSAKRDPTAVMAVYDGTSLNEHQLNNFFDGATPDLANVVTKAEFDVKTYYIQLGYTLPKALTPGLFEVTPYLFWDVYENPETIADKDFGGDNEAGVADDGVFAKPTFGIAIKPVPQIAIKIDGSAHLYKENGKDVSYNEIRADISYFFN